MAKMRISIDDAIKAIKDRLDGSNIHGFDRIFENTFPSVVPGTASLKEFDFIEFEADPSCSIYFDGAEEI